MNVVVLVVVVVVDDNDPVLISFTLRNRACLYVTLLTSGRGSGKWRAGVNHASEDTVEG